LRLRWTVGDATVTSLVESEIPTSPRFLYRNMNKSEVLERAAASPWLRPHFISKDGYLLQTVQSLIISIGDRTIVVDTCIGNDKIRINQGWNRLQTTFLEDMVHAGFDPDEVTDVVCTHLHVDHLGWNTRLVDGEWLPTFPNARYTFVEEEYQHWLNLGGLFYGEDVFTDSVKPVVVAGLVDLVGSSHQICEGVNLVPTPGHTPGHVSVLVSSGGEQAVITGDMVYNPLQIADPTLASRYDTDPDAAIATRIRILNEWARQSMLLIGTHFGHPTAGHLQPDGPGFLFEVEFGATGY